MTNENGENSLSSTNDTTNQESTSSPLNSSPTNDDTTTSENKIEKEELEEEEKEQQQQMELPPPPPKMPEDTVWEACWDENSKNYYYWNTETDEVTWDNPFEGITDKNKIEDKEAEKANGDDNDSNVQENDDENESENYEIEVEGYEEALAEQQKREQEEKEKEKEKEKSNGVENTETPTSAAATSAATVDQTAYVYANPADPNYYYNYGGSYDYGSYASYYNIYDYSQYPATAYAQTGSTADKNTLSNFDSLLNKIDDAKELLDDLADGDTTNASKEKAKDDSKKEKDEKSEEVKGNKEGGEGEESKDRPSYADYWGDYNYAYAYPTPEATAASAVPAASGQFQEYSVTGYFNKRTGRFQHTTNEMMNNPQDYFTPESKGERQMQYYFNPEAYQQQYNMHNSADALGNTDDSKGSSGKRKLTRKEIEHFKKLKKQKRDDKLKRKYMD